MVFPRCLFLAFSYLPPLLGGRLKTGCSLRSQDWRILRVHLRPKRVFGAFRGVLSVCMYVCMYTSSKYIISYVCNVGGSKILMFLGSRWGHFSRFRLRLTLYWPQLFLDNMSKPRKTRIKICAWYYFRTSHAYPDLLTFIHTIVWEGDSLVNVEDLLVYVHTYYLQTHITFCHTVLRRGSVLHFWFVFVLKLRLKWNYV